jgi:long-chain acyl-CoA synthetase
MAEKTTAQKPARMIVRPKTERKYERVRDAYELCRMIEKHGDRTAFTYYDKSKKLYSISYTRFYNRVLRTAAGLTAQGLAGKKIAIIGETSTAWLASYLATLLIGGVAIPMDKELDISAIVGLLESVDTDAIVYSDHFNGKLVGAFSENSTLKKFFPIDPDEAELAHEGVTAYRDMRAQGKALVDSGEFVLNPNQDRQKMAEMLFTSGTTGSSKCVMLSQTNVFSVVTSACASVDFTPDDVIVSVLPVHHTYELAILLSALNYGMHVCINDSISHVLRNFKTFKPTGLVLVPLFVYTMYKRIWAEAKKTGRDKVLKVGLGASRALRAVGIDKRDAIFKEVTEAFGGNLKKIICGGAALNPRMIEFFENLGIHIYEGFGITECSPLVFVTPYYARKYGSVGPTVPCCQARIDGEYLNDKGYFEGEIQVKGDNVMLGYYKNEEATADAFTEDGWFRTGDIGYEDKDGYFYVTGRMKNVIVLENGKNVFPEEIEEYLDGIETIAECAVISRQEGETVNLIALIYPDSTKYPDGTTLENMQADIEKSIFAMNKTLPTYKQVKIVELRDTPFEKTSSRKIKRHLLK